MKKIIELFGLILLLSSLTNRLLGYESEVCDRRFSTTFSAGYVFKDDCTFKKVYGRGMANVITVDGCYHFCTPWGIGAKVSYWRAKGCSTFLQQHTFLYEVPVTLYMRAMKCFKRGVQLYASLGGGIICLKEKSYLGDVMMHKGIGEAELGLNYQVGHCVGVSGAFRYLFPCQSGVQVGGYDLRAGIVFAF